MNENLTVLTIRQVMGMFFRRMVLSYSSLFILAVGGNNSQIGLINSLRPLAGLLVFPISGYYTDRSSRVKIIALADLLRMITMALYVLAPSWEWIAIGGLLQGLMVFSFPPTSAIMVDSLEPKSRGIGVATMNMLSNLISMGSPYIAATILVFYGDEMGMRILYGLLGLQSLFGAILIYRKLEETTDPKPMDEPKGVLSILKDTYSGVPELLRKTPRSVKAMSFVVLLAFISNGVASPFWVVYVTQIIGLSKVNWGLILFYENVMKVVLIMPAGILADRIGRTRTLLMSVLVALLSLPSLIFATNFTSVLLIRFGAALAGSLFIPASVSLIADYTPRNLRGKVMAAMGGGSVLIGAAGGGTGGPGVGYLLVIPLMISSILGGILYDINPVYPWYFVGIATMIQLACVIFYISDPKSVEE